MDNRVSLRISALEKNSVRIIGYCDSSVANDAELSLQLSYICFLGDASDSIIPLLSKSYKSRRVIPSAITREVIAFGSLFYASSTLVSELELMFRKKFPLQLLTDSKSLFDVISKGSCLLKKGNDA